MERRVAPNNLNTLAGGTHFYELRVFFGGNDPVKFLDRASPDFASAAYRCTFDVEKGDDLDAPTKVEKDTEVPLSSSKDKYRVFVHDNHAMRTGGAHRVSPLYHDVTPFVGKPENYAGEGWMRDVRPAVPLRVVLVKKSTDSKKELPFDEDEVKVIWKTLDPAVEPEVMEEAPFNPSPIPKKFMKEFFSRWKRVTNGSKAEDDNVSNQFYDVDGGENVRVRDFPIDPTHTLFKTPFVPAAVERLDRFSTGTDRASSAVKPGVDKESKKPNGVSEVVFRPEPVGGDNYKFVLGLVDKDGNPLKFIGPEGKEVKEIETCPWTVWRKIRIVLVATFTGVDQAFIQWDKVKKSYRPAFVEIVEPKDADTQTFTEVQWKQHLKDFFRNVANPKPSNADINDDSKYHFAQFLFPDYASEDDHLSDFTDFIIQKAAKAKGLKDAFAAPNTDWHPAADMAQAFQPGLCMMLSKSYMGPTTAKPNGSTLLGAYFYNRRFHMCTRGDATCTFAHELGHALYLGHAWTSYDHIFNFDNAGNAKSVKFRMTLEEPANAQVEGHHQACAVACTMAYENDFFARDGKLKRAPKAHATISGLTTNTPVEWFFCPVCLFKLRFFDVARQQGNDLYRDLVLRDLAPLSLKRLSFTATVGGGFVISDVNDMPGTLKIAAGSNKVFLAAFGTPEKLANNSGENFEKNISSMIGGSWTVTPDTVAEFKKYQIGGYDYEGMLERKAGQTGTVTVRFQVTGLPKLKTKSQTIKFE